MEIYNYYLNTANKDNGDVNYNFNFKLGINFHINENQKCYFKLINFSMMNSMLNVSSYHKNNQFQIIHSGTTYSFTIPDGNYTATSLRDKINDLTVNLPFALNYDPITNKYYWVNTDSGIFKPMNMKSLLGFTSDTINLVGNVDKYADTFTNLLPYTKLLITTNNLAFNPSTDNNLNREYSANEGINEIIGWIDKDEPPFSTLKYDNYNDVKFEIANKNFNYINLSIMNEYKEHIRDCPNAFYHFQIIILSI
jgi:hypothetical protein